MPISGRCQAKQKNGKQCRFRARALSKFCNTHKLPSKVVKRGIPANPAQIEAARNLYQNDEVEVDDDAFISPLQDGTGSVWVSAWVYVNGSEIRPVEPKEEVP